MFVYLLGKYKNNFVFLLLARNAKDETSYATEIIPWSLKDLVISEGQDDDDQYIGLR